METDESRNANCMTSQPQVYETLNFEDGKARGKEAIYSSLIQKKRTRWILILLTTIIVVLATILVAVGVGLGVVLNRDTHELDGSWIEWGSWGQCSVTCDVGIERRNRTCDSTSRKYCYGDATDYRICNYRMCQELDGSWNDWGSWGQCSVTCDVGFERRNRTCDSTGGKYCNGDATEYRICNYRMCQETKRCAVGWIQFQESCYLFWNKTYNFYGAAAMCGQYDAHLVFVETEAENDFIKAKLRTLPSFFWWMGITDAETDGIWKYYGTDKVVSFTDWISGEPNNNGGSESCGNFLSAPYDYKWNDYTCNLLFNVLCEKHI